MKKIITTVLAALMLLCSGCNTDLLGVLGGESTGNGTGQGGGLGDILGGVLGGVLGGLGGNTVDGLLGLVIGSVKINESDLYGAWYYTEPGCAFTSENLLAKAGGAVAAVSGIHRRVKISLRTGGGSLGKQLAARKQERNLAGLVRRAKRSFPG